MNEYVQRYANCEFHVEQWTDDDLRVDTLLSCSVNALIARAAYDEATRQRPTRIVRLRHRARIIAEHIPDNLRQAV